MTAGPSRPFDVSAPGSGYDRGGGLALVAYVAALWVEQLVFATESLLPVNPSEGVLVAGVAMTAPRLWQARRSLATPLVALAAALAASLVASTVLAGDGLPVNVAGRLAVQLAVMVWAAAVLGGHVPGAAAIARRGLVAVAVAVVTVTVIGGALGAAGALDPVERALWRPMFVDRTGNPAFGELPRFTGGSSYSAELCGIWAIAAAAVIGAAAPARPRLRPFVGVAVIAAVGTLSIAGAAIAAVLAALAWHARWPTRVGVAIAAVLALAALQWPVHAGARPASAAGPDACETWPNHWAQWRSPDGSTCEIRTYADGRAVTRYALAKAHAAAVWRAAPVVGGGARAFRAHAAAERRGDGWASWNPYVTTHGAWHGIAAEQGLVGLALAAALAVALARGIRSIDGARDRAARVACAAVALGLLAASIDLDVHKLRLTWLLVGAVAGLSRRAA